MNPFLDCNTCRHPFYDTHVETDRRKPAPTEKQRRKCSDCRACHPPQDAPVVERDVREPVPA